ncbi:hypothetical protein ACOMHN_038646 [Nucella lapillus]
MLPKIHKTMTNPPGRPIVSGVNGPTENVSKIVDDWLQPYNKRLPSYIQDTTDMLCQLDKWNRELAPFPTNTRLVTIDVVGLYNNIPHDEMKEAVAHYLQGPKLGNPPPPDTVLRTMTHVLENNVFHFEGEHFLQIFGTAMGTPMAPTIACLFMGRLETQLLDQSPAPVPRDLWRRYIDDIFLLWTGTDEELAAFIRHLNSFHNSIKFTINIEESSISFLDIRISINSGYLQSDVFTKPTDTHAYLHRTSCHPRHVTENIPSAQFTRLRRLCSDPQSFHNRCLAMETDFIKRGP